MTDSTDPATAPAPTPRPSREEQALREVGRTVLGPRVAWTLVVLFLGTVGIVPMLEIAGVAGAGGIELPADLARRVGGALAADQARGPEGARRATGPVARLVAANRLLLEEIDRLEESVEERSLLQATVVPYAQWLEVALLQDGNRRALVGRDGWLFYRPDVEHLIGPGFLEPRVLAARVEKAPSWREPPSPDPRPAIVELGRELAGRGIALLVMPTPVKPMVEARWLTAREVSGDRPSTAPLRNPSFDRFVGELEAAGVAVFDPGPWLAGEDPEEELYLHADTHWRPEAMDRVATALAGEVAARLGPISPPVAYRRQPVVVSGTGDLARMLALPASSGLFPPQQVTTRLVTAPSGELWRPQRGAEVLVLGDSFTNVYSQEGLGWGTSAGLAEQLAYHLARPVDRIAVNAGGAHTTREALARALRSEPGRLDGVRLVVYQFADRELSHGDWRAVDILRPGGRGSDAPPDRLPEGGAAQPPPERLP